MRSDFNNQLRLILACDRRRIVARRHDAFVQRRIAGIQAFKKDAVQARETRRTIQVLKEESKVQ